MQACDGCECWQRFREEQQWLAQKVERKEPLGEAQRFRILQTLVHADAFERFLALHFPNSKVCAKVLLPKKHLSLNCTSLLLCAVCNCDE